MGTIKSTGQITLIDYNDDIQMVGYISANTQKTQIKNKDTGSYSPDWTATSLKLTPHVYSSNKISDPIIGDNGKISSTSGIYACAWFENNNYNSPLDYWVTEDKQGDSTVKEELGITSSSLNWTGHTLSFGDSGTSTIYTRKENLSEGTSADYIFVALRQYNGAYTKIVLNFGISCVINGMGIASAVIEASATSFKNGEPKSITLTAKLYRGGTEDNDGTTYAWYKDNDTTSKSTTKTYTITKEDVTNISSFKCVITDDGNSYSDTITITDITDPITTVINSTNGNVFKTGQIETTLYAELYQNGNQKVSGQNNNSGYYFLWEINDSDGNFIAYNNSAAYNYVSIPSSLISSKAIVSCEVYDSDLGTDFKPSGTDGWSSFNSTNWFVKG